MQFENLTGASLQVNIMVEKSFLIHEAKNDIPLGGRISSSQENLCTIQRMQEKKRTSSET